LKIGVVVNPGFKNPIVFAPMGYPYLSSELELNVKSEKERK